MPILDRLLAIIAPHRCLNCGVEGALLCPACLQTCLRTPPERCFRCRAISAGNKTCKPCRSSSRLAHVWVGSDYWGVVQQLVKKLKFERARPAVDIMAAHLAKDLSQLPPNVLFVPVPTARNRVRQRGYDQAELLARALARSLNQREASVLMRVGKTRQVGTKREKRLKQLDQAFKIRRSQKIRGADIILVDDVLTTGATLEAAAKTLRQAGAKHVDAIVFAQA